MMMMIRLTHRYIYFCIKKDSFLLLVSPLLLEQLSVLNDDRPRRFNFLIKTSKIYIHTFKKRKEYLIYLLLTRRNSKISCSSFCRPSCSLLNSFRKSTKRPIKSVF